MKSLIQSKPSRLRRPSFTTRNDAFYITLVLALMVYFSGLTATSCATELLSLDGVWWQALSSDEKVAAVEGMLAEFERESHNDPRKPTFSKTIGTYTDDLDAFYQAHPKRVSTVHPASLMVFCFADKPQFQELNALGVRASCDTFGSNADRQ